MTDTVKGFGEMAWLLVGYDGTDEILRQIYPLNSTPEERIENILEKLASQHLNQVEIDSGMARVRKDYANAKRIMLMAGDNPHYVASLWRSDELEERLPPK